jgi:tetratricopeptide (TPR) repeat protein
VCRSPTSSCWAANTYFQLQNYARAEEVASALLKTTTTGQPAADARLVLGLSLALQNKFAEAVPVFTALEESTVYRDKALMYRSMAAQQSNQPLVAIDALNRLLASAPRDADWADSALTLIALQLQQNNLPAAHRGLELLRGSFGTVDNLAGLNVLSLQLGDTLLAANDLAGALTAYRTVLPRSELLRLQKQRIQRMEAIVARQKTVCPVARWPMQTRLAESKRVSRQRRPRSMKSESAPITMRPFSIVLGHTFLMRGGAWEAAIIFERLLKEYPKADERELAYSELVRGLC